MLVQHFTNLQRSNGADVRTMHNLLRKPRLLVVEDEAIVARDLQAQLELLGYETVGHAASGERAIELSERLRPDLVLMDIRLSGPMDGIAAAQAIRARFSIPAVFLTASAEDETLERARLAEPLGYILKPFGERSLHTVLEIALYKHQADAKLRLSNAALKAVSQGVLISGADRLMVSANEAFCRITGYPVDEVLGRNCKFLQGPLTDAGTVAAMGAALSRGESFSAEILNYRKDGSTFWNELTVSPVRDAENQLTHFIGVTRDITQRRQAEAALSEKTEILAAVISSASDAVITVDAAFRIQLFNHAAERIFGHAAVDTVGLPLARLLPDVAPGRGDAQPEACAQTAAGSPSMSSGRVRGLRADGAAIEFEASVSQVTVRGQKMLTVILHDVTERVQAEQAMRLYQRELSELTRRLMDQEKETTRRLAQTLHDRLGQTLTAIRLSYDALAPCLADRSTGVPEGRARTLGGLIDRAIQEVREALVELRPPMLEEEGLCAAIDNELRTRQAEAEPVALRLVVAPDVQALRWAAPVEYAAFMVVREAVSNALLHADATDIQVHVAGSTTQLDIEVSDDGSGLPSHEVFGKAGHLGMVGMRERAAAIGGAFRAGHGPAGGATIKLAWKATP